MKKYSMLVFAIAAMISACSPAAPAAPLIGTTWKLTSYGRLNDLNPIVAEEGVLTLGTDGKLSGVGACNEFSGTYEVKENQIILSRFVWGSKGCPEPQMTQESTVWDTLDNHTVDFKIEGSTLTISRKISSEDALVLVFEASKGG